MESRHWNPARAIYFVKVNSNKARYFSKYNYKSLRDKSKLVSKKEQLQNLQHNLICLKHNIVAKRATSDKKQNLYIQYVQNHSMYDYFRKN